MKSGKVIIWSSLLGFDRNDPDKGVERYLNQTGFVPDSICALLYHSDFFNQYRGMEEEYVLPPDNCAYYGIPRNVERERQPWTNYDLRELVANLTKAGSNLYASIFGGSLNNAFHQEWGYEHPEIRRHGRCGEENGTGHFVLKRFKDGSYYEDFYIEKVCQALQDYGMKGIHLGDGFCPPAGGMLHSMEFSTDFVEQFLDHSGVALPEEVSVTMGLDDEESETKRADWIYRNKREEWIEFNAWRWEVFFKKLCNRVHAIGKEVLVLGMYCTDPFESLYCIGIDLKRLVEAGVDCITANILPTSCYILGKDEGKEQRPYYFHRYMALAPITAAYLPKGHLISMLSMQDAAEEWSVMHHMPCQHERDMYTMMSYQLIDKDGFSRALDGFWLCLGEGISRNDWDWERERLEIALSTQDAERVVSPAMLWSDTAHDAMLHEYIHTRRWTPFKLFYELAKGGAHCAAAIRLDGLEQYSGTLVVPNFDMLSAEEKQAVAAYDRGSVLCTASPDFNPVEYGITPEIIFTDGFSDWPMTAFAFNCSVSQEVRSEIDALLSMDDGVPNLVGDPMQVKEPEYTLMDTLVFAKVTTGFRDAMSLLLNKINDVPFDINKPNIILKMKDGAYRLYLFNDSEVKYRRAFVISQKEILDAKIISKFPILPPRYIETATGMLQHIYTDEKKVKKSFEIKLQPGGVTIIDVYVERRIPV